MTFVRQVVRFKVRIAKGLLEKGNQQVGEGMNIIEVHYM
jgi:hypothetical protein